MKKMKLFVMFYMVKMFERIGDNMYLNIRVELKKNENQVLPHFPAAGFFHGLANVNV